MNPIIAQMVDFLKVGVCILGITTLLDVIYRQIRKK